ncbi:DUF4129 domain-containing protein [Pedobacter mucosus]|uniref:DUF4129 domain-containing protein n=1 Tax=Pedobacter mucosus TaxID=2895286 RepID=UPI001EE4C8B1|nr:DUF4129 domain-containing protein [Pedobacter mucosus]UKT63771.1 DUF4129 domain-containing protein [Pedobacter mucosus]
MFKHHFLYLLFILFLANNINGYGQPNSSKKVIAAKIDSSKITPATFNKEAIRNYADQKEFKYDEAQTEQLSLWDRFWFWFWKTIGNLFSGAAENPISKFFFIGIGIAVVAFIIYKLIGADRIFSKKSKESMPLSDVLYENIHEIDYEKELQKLIAEGKYRLSVRLLYLRTLKKLSDAGIIKWQPEKTNYNYLSEISKPELKSAFSELTHQFDYIWYGDFPINASKFEPINQSFNHFNNQIK